MLLIHVPVLRSPQHAGKVHVATQFGAMQRDVLTLMAGLYAKGDQTVPLQVGAVQTLLFRFFAEPFLVSHGRDNHM